MHYIYEILKILFENTSKSIAFISVIIANFIPGFSLIMFFNFQLFIGIDLIKLLVLSITISFALYFISSIILLPFITKIEKESKHEQSKNKNFYLLSTSVGSLYLFYSYLLFVFFFNISDYLWLAKIWVVGGLVLFYIPVWKEFGNKIIRSFSQLLPKH